MNLCTYNSLNSVKYPMDVGISPLKALFLIDLSVKESSMIHYGLNGYVSYKKVSFLRFPMDVGISPLN